MKATLSIILLYLFFPISVFSNNIYCTGHDACRNKVWSGEYNIYCGASNSERTCKNTVLNCGEGDDCLIKTQGSGHDAYQYSTVNAKTAASFKLYCQASGQRDCKSITVWCPQESGSTCECVSCPSTVTFKCVQGVSCSSVSNAHVDYVQSDTYSIPDSIWYKDTAHSGKRPDCPFSKATSHENYLWGNLAWCKTKCIEESTGKCNMVSRFGDSTKSPTQPYHCRFYECPDPNNFTWVTQEQWGNYANECNTYMLPIRHYTLESRYVNVTRYINETIYNNINTEIFKYINTSKSYYNNKTIENICIELQTNYYSGNGNPSWTRESWILGCNQYSLGYTTPSLCNSQCYCSNAPTSFSSHPQYRKCSKENSYSNYIPCAHNRCSGGSCCSRSTTICREACSVYHAIKLSSEIITYKNVYKDIYVNKTKYINVTNYVQRLKYTPYQIKIPGTNTCPIGFSHIKNINECQKAQQEVASDKSFQGIPHPEHPVSGCYYDTLHNRVYMPPASHGTGSNHMSPICKATCENITNKMVYNYVNKTLYNYINKTIVHYLNETLYNYKNITNVNEIIKYVNKTRYVNIPNYTNVTRYINVTHEIIHLINKYNYINKTNIINITKVLTKIIWREKYNITNVKNITNIIKIRWKNKTRWINKTNYKQVVVKVPVVDNNTTLPPSIYNSYDKTPAPKIHRNDTCNCKEVEPMSFWVQIGFFITLGFSTFAALVCIWRCWLKEMIEDYIDDLFCCGYGEEVKNFCECLCICCELCRNDDTPEVEPDEELELPRMVPRLDENIPTARPVNKNLIIDTNANPIYRIDEGVTTPGGTQIRRRTVQV